MHYVCSGNCQGISQKPGNCQTQDCDKFGQPLYECDCADGMGHQFMTIEVEEEE